MKCKICKKQLNKQQHKFCSKKCYAVKMKSCEYARKHKKYGRCLNCKNKFKKIRPRNIFCSRKCYWESSFISKKSRDTQLERLKNKTHNLYISGSSSKNQKIRRSAKYLTWRKKVFIRDNFTCQECNERGGELNADHIKPFAYYPELRFSIDNGRTLCKPCHLKTETFGIKAKNFSNDSQIQSLLIIKNKDKRNPRIEIQL